MIPQNFICFYMIFVFVSVRMVNSTVTLNYLGMRAKWIVEHLHVFVALPFNVCLLGQTICDSQT